MHVFNRWRLDVGDDVGNSRNAPGYPNDLRFEIRVSEDAGNIYPATVTSNVEDDIACLRRGNQRGLDSRCHGEVAKGPFRFRRRLILGTSRRFSDEETSHLRIDAGGVEDQIVTDGILPVDIKKR